MSGWWGVGLVGGAVLGWALFLDWRHGSDERLARWWVAKAGSWGVATGPCAFLVSVAALGSYALVAVLADRMAGSLGDPRWSLAVTLPAMLAYAPFVFATSPVDPSAYAGWRRELAAAGADARTQRRIAWWAGPPSLMGLVSMIATLATIFVP